MTPHPAASGTVLLDRPAIMLCADDFAISDGVSAGIEELTGAGRLSATSALVTFPEWPGQAKRLAALRSRIAIGLHLNLTVGAPLGHMSVLAPGGTLPPVLDVIGRSISGAVDIQEIEAEVFRQLTRFADAVGHAPDFVDGHQHVHVLPRIRTGVLAALQRFASKASVMLRNPGDSPGRILRRGLFVSKAFKLAWLARGFSDAVRQSGFLVNDGFSGLSNFDVTQPYDRELRASVTAAGPRHLMMCHPGHTDDLLRGRDTVTLRREQELKVLMTAEGLTDRLWRPDRIAADLWQAWRV